MLLAAGRATRLGPLGLALPKPLVPICGYPAIRFGLAACARAGLRRGGGQPAPPGRSAARDAGRRRGGRGARFATPSSPSCSGRAAESPTRARCWARARAGHQRQGRRRRRPARRCSGAPRRSTAPRRHWCCATTPTRGAGARSASTRPAGSSASWPPVRRSPPEGPVAERMFTGIHVMEPALLDRLQPDPLRRHSRRLYPRARGRAPASRAQRLDGYFAEHSTPARYLAGNLDLLAQPVAGSHPPGPLTGIDPTRADRGGARVDPPYRIAAGAVIEPGAEVGPAAVIGARRAGRAGARVRHAVVWADAVVDGEVAAPSSRRGRRRGRRDCSPASADPVASR